MGNILNRFGFSTGVDDGLWKHHWGVDITPYATNGKIAILLRDDLLCAFTATTNNGTQYNVKIFGKSGELSSTNVNSAATYQYDNTAYSDAFDEVNNQGYGVYVATIEAVSNSLKYLQFSTPTGKTVNYISAHVWVVCNANLNGYSYRFGAAGTFHSENLESYELLQGRASMYGFYMYTNINGLSKLEKVVVNDMTYSVDGYENMYPQRAYQGCTALKEVPDVVFDRTNYIQAYSDCRSLNNDISGTYTAATTMNNMLVNNYNRERDINIVAPYCTDFGGNTGMYKLRNLSISAPLILFNIQNAYSLVTLSVTNTNFKSLLTTTTAVDIRNLIHISATEITNFINGLESLVGYVTQNISKAGVTNWSAAHTTAAQAKNWTVI